MPTEPMPTEPRSLPLAPLRIATMALVAIAAATSTVRAREVPLVGPAAAGAGWSATEIVAADFDGDGDVDLAATAEADDEIRWLEAAGGGLIDRLVIGSLDAPRDLVAADLDCDGDPDLVASVTGTGSIAWGRNDGAGVWAVGGIVVAGATAVGDLVVGAVTRDAVPDVIAVVDGEVRLYRRTSCGSPAWSGSTVASGVGDSAHLALADIDRDGRLDVAIADPVASRVEWRENPGSAGLWTGHTVDAATAATWLVAADPDRDGDADLIGAVPGSGGAVWWANDGAGGGWADSPVGTVASAERVAAADVDGDGDLDVVALTAVAAGTISWWDNLLGDASAWEERPFGSRPASGTGLVVADLGGDGDADLVLGAADGLSVWENVSTARSALFDLPGFDSSYPFPLREIADLETGDVDGDGDLDLVVVERDRTVPSGFVYWFENHGASVSGTLQLAGPHLIHFETLHSTEAVATGDLDGDGDLDVFVGNVDTLAFHGVVCLQGAVWSCTNVIATSAAEGFDAVALHDLDGDGDLDVLASPTGPTGTGSVAWWEQDGDPALAASWTRHDIANPSDGRDRLSAVDLDRDGDLDVVGGAEAWRNDGAAWTPIVMTSTVLEDFAVTDIDRDGDPDLVAVALTVAGTGLSWFENDPAFPLGPWAEHPIRTPDTTGTFGPLVVADVDRDGDDDVAIGRFEAATERLRWYENDDPLGGGDWTEREATPTGFGVRRMLVGDFDRDGDPDLIVAEDELVVGAWLNGGGQFAAAATAVAPASVPEGAEAAVLALEVVHRGRVGEADLELAGVALRFESAVEAPLSDAELAALVAAIRLYRDDGSGAWEPGNDVLTASAPPPALVDGAGVFTLLPGSLDLQQAPGAGPITFFVTVELVGTAATAGFPTLRVAHLPGAGTTARDAVQGTPLLLESASTVTASFAVLDSELFADDFESGDTAAWDLTEP